MQKCHDNDTSDHKDNCIHWRLHSGDLLQALFA